MNIITFLSTLFTLNMCQCDMSGDRQTACLAVKDDSIIIYGSHPDTLAYYTKRGEVLAKYKHRFGFPTHLHYNNKERVLYFLHVGYHYTLDESHILNDIYDYHIPHYNYIYKLNDSMGIIDTIPYKNDLKQWFEVIGVLDSNLAKKFESNKGAKAMIDEVKFFRNPMNVYCMVSFIHKEDIFLTRNFTHKTFTHREKNIREKECFSGSKNRLEPIVFDNIWSDDSSGMECKPRIYSTGGSPWLEVINTRLGFCMDYNTSKLYCVHHNRWNYSFHECKLEFVSELPKKKVKK